jgi:hypothetical protein
MYLSGTSSRAEGALQEGRGAQRGIRTSCYEPNSTIYLPVATHRIQLSIYQLLRGEQSQRQELHSQHQALVARHQSLTDWYYTKKEEHAAEKNKLEGEIAQLRNLFVEQAPRASASQFNGNLFAGQAPHASATQFNEAPHVPQVVPRTRPGRSAPY